MLLIDVATASADIGAAAARLAKIARIAALLGQVGADGAPAAIVVAWLSGDLPQRQIGVGWAALQTLPEPAAAATLTVTDVDARF
ncbi:MAG: ATP-dependent DNA ligase, partial [Mycobacterium sp.]